MRCKLSDIASVIDSLHQTPKYSDYGYPMVRVRDIYEGYFYIKDCVYVDKGVYLDFTRNHTPSYGDIIITRVGSYGVVCFVATKDKFCLGQNTAIISRFKSELVDNKYLYYYMISPNIKKQIEYIVTGSTQKTISLKNIRDLEINLPPLPTQRRIAAILSSLDDKIENNRKTCEKLEEIAQAIYKRWFVEFEFPNEHGQPYKSSGGEMVYCDELGKEIPKGWRVKPFGDIVDSISERHSFNKPELIFLNTSDIYNGEVLKSGYTNITTLPGQAKKSIQIKDILYSEIRPKNRRFAYIDFECVDYVVSTKLMVLRCKDSKLSSLVYFYLTNQDTINNLQTLAESRSGTFPQIRFDNLKNMTVALPMHCSQFTSFFETFLEQMQMNRREIRLLQQTRDALLPKLMSGELTVDDVAK